MGTVAIIGGSANSFWTQHSVSNLRHFGYPGRIAVVNKRPVEVPGVSSFTSIADIDGTIDAALVAVSNANANAVLAELGQRRCQDVVVLTDGYRERGAEGRELEKGLVAAAGEVGRMYGPNCIGFADFHRQLVLIAEPLPADVRTGSTSLISQSGAVLSSGLAALTRDRVGIDWVASIGNAATFDLPIALEYLVDRGTTRTICLYVETLGDDPGRLSLALERCRAAGISIVALMPGRSARTREVALSHTGSVVGEHEHMRAFVARHGVYLVETLSELARVAALLEVTVPAGVRTVHPLVVGGSGGGAVLTSEAMHRAGVTLPATSEATLRKIAPLVAPGSYLGNPMDLVGKVGFKNALVEIYELVWGDASFNLIVNPWPISTYPDDSEFMGPHRGTWERIVHTAQAVGKPAIISSVVDIPMTGWVRAFQERHPEILVLPDIELTAAALGVINTRHAEFDEPEQRTVGRSGDVVFAPPAAEIVVCGEAEGRALLARHDVALVRGVEARDLATLRERCAGLAPPFVVKVASEGVAHKADAGLVRMDVCSVDDAVATARAMVEDAGLADGTFDILVQETVHGQEVMCSWTRTSHGLFLTVGSGGGGPMERSRYRTIALPASPRRLGRAVRALNVVPEGAPLDALVTVIVDVSRLYAERLHESFSLLELNPVIVSRTGARIVDVLLHRAASPA